MKFLNLVFYILELHVRCQFEFLFFKDFKNLANFVAALILKIIWKNLHSSLSYSSHRVPVSLQLHRGSRETNFRSEMHCIFSNEFCSIPLGMKL